MGFVCEAQWQRLSSMAEEDFVSGSEVRITAGRSGWGLDRIDNYNFYL
jgi:hypothetical protein